ncbi:MAG: dihydroneopterin aldolase [Pseudarcicella sp.]|nr:dihydroneopterin aldolase [Pseudarcicella sp.]MBP6409575.1 dihydroneopterin aldolase [Pseudarcicella sp.]
MGKIALEGMEFFAYHGVSDEEQKIGNKYQVDVELDCDINAAAVSDDLKYTINYAEVYLIVDRIMAKKTRLLEHIAFNIIEEIKQQFQQVDSVTVEVSKFNPPLGGICARSKITLSA